MSTILFAAFVICLTGMGLSFASIIQPQPKLGLRTRTRATLACAFFLILLVITGVVETLQQERTAPPASEEARP
ncbi:MAG: hypothetical protein F4X19_11500 [Acidobacteria bacterium]|nr:hypothetical protein [Acidobacteriota bacterium]MYC82704.1 hypothetical protein [Acidobacteriota bacterium]